MVVGEIADAVDLLVVGGGPGGYVAAARAAALGRDVVLVDRDGPGGLGGSCLHVGCIPSKALVELAETAHRLACQPGIDAALRIDLPAWQAHKRGILARLSSGIETLMNRGGVRVLRGELRFSRPDRAVVLLPDGNSTFLEFSQAILATGSRPSTLAGLAPDGERILDSTGALALEEVPDRVAIVGAGYIGLEVGTALAKLGAHVTVVEALDRILPTFDASLVTPVARRLNALGIDVRLNTLAREVDDDALVLADSDGAARVQATKVIVAVGRQPNTDALGLDRLGIKPAADGLIPVAPNRLATDRVAAIGDITAGPALAHKASAEGVVAAEALCGHRVAFEPWAIPLVAFTDPEVASTGLTETQARQEGLDAVTRTAPLTASGRAATLGAPEGFAKIVVDRSSERIVGVHLVGPHASELIAEGTLAVEMMAAPADLADTIHPHPTLSETLHDAIGRPAAS